MRESIVADKLHHQEHCPMTRRASSPCSHGLLEMIDGIDAGGRHLPAWRFTDCGYSHVESTGKVGAFKLTNCRRYGRGDERNQMLQRIYGVVLPKRSWRSTAFEAERRDHRRLGRELACSSSTRSPREARSSCPRARRSTTWRFLI
jgi:hypothetical protein